MKSCLKCKKEMPEKTAKQRRRVFCSRGCSKSLFGSMNYNYKNAGHKKCWCGADFKTYNKARKFCTYPCSNTFKRLQPKKPKKRKKYAPIKKQTSGRVAKIWTCRRCEQVVPRRTKVCKTCKQKKAQNIPTKECLCGKTFISVRWGVERKYCSTNCYRSNIHGKANPNYKDGRKSLKLRIRDLAKPLYVKVKERDGFCCQSCGQIGGRLESDHIMPFSKIYEDFMKDKLGSPDDEVFLLAKNHFNFFDLNNFQTLCRKCNMRKMTKTRDFRVLVNQ
jgi:hypothetical protein